MRHAGVGFASVGIHHEVVQQRHKIFICQGVPSVHCPRAAIHVQARGGRQDGPDLAAWNVAGPVGGHPPGNGSVGGPGAHTETHSPLAGHFTESQSDATSLAAGGDKNTKFPSCFPHAYPSLSAHMTT